MNKISINNHHFIFDSPTIFITNFTVSGGDAKDFNSVNCPFSICSSANLAASSTGSALALYEIL